MGPHVADYAALTLKFFHQGKFITLQGECVKSATHAQLHHLRRLNMTNSIAECFIIQVSQPEVKEDILGELPTNMDPELALLLHIYQEVFKVPKGLPPQSDQDHAIPLQQGSDPVKVKPYIYPHIQKDQIEKMIKEMLE